MWISGGGGGWEGYDLHLSTYVASHPIQSETAVKKRARLHISTDIESLSVQSEITAVYKGRITLSLII